MISVSSIELNTKQRKFTMEQGKITLTDESGNEIDFFILEQTTLAGETYILVTDQADEEAEEAEALILREGIGENDEVTYETVDDEDTLKALSKVFEELLDEIEIDM